MVVHLRALARVIRWEEPWELEDDDDVLDEEGMALGGPADGAAARPA